MSKIEIKDEDLGPFLSCLLNSKFNGDIRMEIITSPILNDVINQVIEYGIGNDLPSPWFNNEKIFELSEEVIGDNLSVFFKINKYLDEMYDVSEKESLLKEAIFPYHIKK